MTNQLGVDARQLENLREVPLWIRFLLLFSMGLVPASFLFSCASTAVPNLGVLEAALFYTIITVILVSVLVNVIPDTMRLLVHTVAIALTTWWVTELYRQYAHGTARPLSISVWLSIVLITYLSRIEIVSRRKGKVLDSLHIHFKLDCAAMVVSIGFFAVSTLFEHHFKGLSSQIAVLDFSCITLWAVVFWQIENKVAQRMKRIQIPYFGLLLATVTIAAIELPAFLLMTKVNVLVNQYQPVPPNWIDKPKHNLRPIAVATSSGMKSGLSHFIIVILFAIVIIGLVLYLVLSRKQPHRSTSAVHNAGPGVMQTTQRHAVPLRKNRSFLQTQHPIRRRMQRWLRHYEHAAKGLSKADSIRTLVTRNDHSDFKSVLDEYERVRYNPETEKR